MSKYDTPNEVELQIKQQTKATSNWLEAIARRKRDQAYYLEEIEMRDKVIEKLSEKIEQFIEVQDRNNDLFKATQASYLHEVAKNNYLEARVAELENRRKL